MTRYPPIDLPLPLRRSQTNLSSSMPFDSKTMWLVTKSTPFILKFTFGHSCLVGISPPRELTNIWHLSRAMERLCFSTYASNMKECDAPKSNSPTAVVALMKKHTKDNIWSFLHSNMIDPSSSVVLLSGNKYRVGSTGGGGCSCRW
jgi:hypothetical protein